MHKGSEENDKNWIILHNLTYLCCQSFDFGVIAKYADIFKPDSYLNLKVKKE